MIALRIGIDVGGTNTDAVLMDGDRVVASVKTPTTSDRTTGISLALGQVMADSGAAAAEVSAVVIGTTHFVNAVLQRRDLLEIAIIRLALPATQALPPMTDWPSDLRSRLGAHTYFAHGGVNFNGRSISPLDSDELKRIAEDIRAKGLRSVALTSVFSPIDDTMEHEAAEILRRELPDVAMSLSSEIGRIGLLERENATIVNACLTDLSAQVVSSFERSLAILGITAPFFVSQNDGTLMTADYARRYPVRTFASGPTNSMRGAAFLSGVTDGIVVDVGGTTTDVGAITNGYPRPASIDARIAGIRTNFRMPDVISISIGGGSVVKTGGDMEVGPESVGYDLLTKAVAFGGSVLTTSDAAVAAGLMSIGDRTKLRELSPRVVRDSLRIVRDRIEGAIDRVKLTPELVPVVVVGGGAPLIPAPIRGASEVIVPNHSQFANAIGAAIAQAGGEAEKIFSLEHVSRAEAIESTQAEAVRSAVLAGADPTTVVVVDLEDVPLTYLPGNAVRVRVKAVGDLL